MSRSALLIALLAAALLLSSGCASRTPTTVPAPTATPLPAPTATVPSDSTPVPCRAGSEAYTDSTIGFSACYPSGWELVALEDPESPTQGVDFVS